MIRMRHILAAVLAALCLASAPRNAVGQDAVAGGPGEWLSQYSGARTVGMGGAFVAVADDALGVLWNPAGLSGMDRNELRFESVRLMEDTAVHGFGFAVPGSWLPSFGLTVLSLRSGEFQKTNEMNDDLGTFANTETAYLFTVSKGFSPRFALGANLKLVQQQVEEFSAGGMGVDLGAWYDVTPGLRLAGAAMNLGGPSLQLRDLAETYPTQLRGGMALRVLQGRGLVALQVDHAEGLGARVHGGAEYWIQPALALRVGLDHENGTGGLSFRFAPAYQLDYGVVDQALGLSHRVAVSYQFGGFFASSQAEPSVFSPTGENAVTRLALDARTKADPESWSLELTSPADEVVRRFGGPGQPPTHVQWDGKDENGLPLADGTYKYRLTVKDRAGRVVAGPVRRVEISTSGPQGDVPVLPVQ